MFDKNGIIDHLQELKLAMKDWKKYQKYSLADLEFDRDKRNMIFHAMLITIQSSIDIANHLISEFGFDIPRTYRETFLILIQKNIISKELGDKLADLASFRNYLVHIYWKIDIKLVYNILQNELIYFQQFLEKIKPYLKKFNE